MKKKFFLFILSNTIALLIFAQPYAFSIYESGIAVNHSEDNFKNLFNNWNSDFISYSKSLDLLSYSYVGEVKSKSQINDIAEQCTKDETLFCNTTRVFTTYSSLDSLSIESISVEIMSWKEFGITYTLLKKDVQKVKNEYMDKMKQQIQIGDKMFVVEGIFSGQPFKNYVLCNGETSKVVWDNIYFSIK